MSNSQNKNSIDAQLFVNCTFDMDYLEITKNESLRKYEENVYLLGTIFSNKINKNEEDHNNNLMDVEREDINQDLNEEILNLFTPVNKKISNTENELKADIIEEEILELLKEITNNSGEDGEKSEISNPEGDEMERILLKQVKDSLKDLKEHETLLNNNKNNFKETTGKFSEFYQKMRGIKTSENDLFFNEALKQADEIGVLSETYKQYDNFIRERHRYNCELPFDPSNNIIIMPL